MVSSDSLKNNYGYKSFARLYIKFSNKIQVISTQNNGFGLFNTKSLHMVSSHYFYLLAQLYGFK